MKLWKILPCLLLAVLLCACSQSTEQEMPQAATVQTEYTPEQTAAPTESVSSSVPVPTCPPAPVIEWAVPEEDTTRQQTSVEVDETTMDQSLWRTEHAYDQNGALMEVRIFVFDPQNRPEITIIQKMRANGMTYEQQNTGYWPDGSVSSDEYVLFNENGQDHLRREYATAEDGSICYDNTYRYDYDDSGKLTGTVSRHNPGGNLLTARVERYNAAGEVIEQSDWEFYENGSIKYWSHNLKAEDGILLEEHRMRFSDSGSFSNEQFFRYSPSGVQLETKELRCHENGIVAHDFYEKYTEDGEILETSRLQYKEDGSLSFLHIEKYDEDGNDIFYQHEQFFEDGSYEHKQRKEYYENGRLRFMDYQSYHSPGVPASISYTEYDENGNLLKKDSTEYDENGVMTSQSKYPAEDGGELMPVKKNTAYGNGNPEYIYDGLYNTEGMLMDGKAERYYENGQLWIQETASYDESTRTRTSAETRYLEDGTVELAWQRMEVFDGIWQCLSSESTSLDRNLQPTLHELYRYTYDENGNRLTQTSVTDDGNGNILFNNSSDYTYDKQGNLLREDRLLLNPDGSFQSRMELLYTYSEAGRQTGTATIQYDETDALVYRLAEEHNDAGLLTCRTVETKNNIQTEAYTYYDDGKMHTLLVTVTPKDEKSEPVIQYRKTTWEYHENGAKKSETTQNWTSKDEKKAAPGTPQSELGTTYITNYDENGNRI